MHSGGRHDGCGHQSIATDAVTDTFVCTDCGLVMPERPSLSVDTMGSAHSNRMVLSTRASAYLVHLARVLAVTSRHMMIQAVNLAIETGATVRHPGSLAACLIVASGMSVHGVSKTLGIEHRILSRAVSRIRRRKLKC